MKNENLPIIVGAAQYRQEKDQARPLHPLGLMEEASRRALIDTGSAEIRNSIDEIHVVNLFLFSYHDAPGLLARNLGLNAQRRYYTAVGGNTPQALVNNAVRALAAGECRAVLMTGAEAFYALRRSSKGKVVLDWPQSESPARIDGNNQPGVSALERSYGLSRAIHVYPLFETALRASSGRSPEEHRKYLGELWARLSRIASTNPYAWIRRAASAEEIATPGSGNRYISYPYTKRMNANIDVDQSAALIMTTEKTAIELGIDPARWVYPLAGVELNEIWFVSRRPRLDNSQAIRLAARLCLDRAGLSLNDIGVFDLYSCFPCVVEIARREIGIPEDDGRDLSVTGGLAYFGGPGNNYSMHAIASVVDRIRKNRKLKAMVTANGFYLTKHAVGIYGGERPSIPVNCGEATGLQASIDASALPEPLERAEGEMRVEAYVIRHDKKGEPEQGTVIGRVRDGSRCLAHIEASAASLLEMEKFELVGKTGRVRFDPEKGLNLISFSDFPF